MATTRRDFLRSTALGAAALGLAGTTRAAARPLRPRRALVAPQAKNLIFMVSDGGIASCVEAKTGKPVSGRRMR